jgi:hypothetical protein
MAKTALSSDGDDFKKFLVLASTVGGAALALMHPNRKVKEAGAVLALLGLIGPLL